MLERIRSVLTSPSIVTVDELRRWFMMQLVFFTVVNAVSAGISLATNDVSLAEKSAVFASFVVLWSCVPFGAWGALTRNSGMICFYVMYGFLSAAARIVLRVAASVMVVTSCQMEQTSFKGCSYAGTEVLPYCLQSSTCTRDNLSYYFSNGMCKAWAVEDCRNAPEGHGVLGFTGLKVLFLILDVLTACLPVYVAFFYVIRLEAVRAAAGETCVSKYPEHLVEGDYPASDAVDDNDNDCQGAAS